jgi:hypothetical protein
VSKIFKEIDRDNSGSLDHDELATYLRLLAREKLELKLADKHHLMSLPKSLDGFYEDKLNANGIEKALFEKIEQHTTRDTDRYRHVLSMLRNQVRLMLLYANL